MFFALGLQGIIVLLAALAALAWQEGTTALALAYGGSTAWISAGLLVWRWRRGRYVYHCDARKHLQSFHRSLMERFFVVVGMLAIGLGVLHLPPKAVIFGFIVGQIAWIIAASALRQFDAPGANLKS